MLTKSRSRNIDSFRFRTVEEFPLCLITYKRLSRYRCGGFEIGFYTGNSMHGTKLRIFTGFDVWHGGCHFVVCFVCVTRRLLPCHWSVSSFPVTWLAGDQAIILDLRWNFGIVLPLFSLLRTFERGEQARFYGRAEGGSSPPNILPSPPPQISAKLCVS